MIPALTAAFMLAHTPVEPPTPAPTCSPPPGAEQLWAAPETRFVILGEIHGTTETPAAFAGMVCAASAGRPVVVGLEFEDTAQPAFDAWMASKGTPADRDALLASTAFTRRFEDGRSSAAMLNLMEDLRRLRAEGREISVVAFRPGLVPPPGFDQNYGELAMAQNLSRMAQDRPGALALVLVGRFHASLQPAGAVRPAASHLPRAGLVSISLAVQGGSLWSCGGDGPTPACGPGEVPGADDGQRGVMLSPTADGRFDGSLALGPTTASPPAREVHP